MKTPRFALGRIALALACLLSVAAHGGVAGQWDFNSGDLSATMGAPLEYRGDTAASTVFTTALIGGQTAYVMQFPATTPSQGYIMTHGIAPNGGGSYVNQYTLIMDIMFPAASTGVWRSLFQTNPNNSNDGDLFVNTANGIGISGVYDGTILADTWHRVAVVVDLTLPSDSLRKFVDGTLVGTQTLSSGVDGRWSLDPTALFFADEDNETAMGYVNSIQIHDTALSDALVASLGGPTAEGIPMIPEPASGLLLGGGLLLGLLAGGRRSARLG